MQYLFEISNKLINGVKKDFSRSLFTKIDWQQRLIEIVGSRGVGKTTLMLQKAKELSIQDPNSVIYISLDDIYFFNHTLKETAAYFYKYGVKYIFIDEVHKYPSKHVNYDWSLELKNIYDLYPELHLIYSGSSIIELYKGNGDLSRRKSTYHLNGLSFREYLEFNKALSIECFKINDIFENHIEISNHISSQVKILPHFKDYLNNGYYPFYYENPPQYYQRLKNIINLVIEIDISSVIDLNFHTVTKIKKLLALIASSVPFTPNLTKLSKELHIKDLRTLYKYLSLLENAELITMLSTQKQGNRVLHKPEKIFLNNTNLIYALNNDTAKIGTVRETYLCNQLNYSHTINYPDHGDFIVNRKYIIEVGGKNKTKKQIKDIKNAFIASDEIETGFANKIPLWIFGFLY
jgi:predicted AAA+ superfamily ATPase